MADDLYDAVIRNQVYLERLKAGYIKGFETFLRRLGKDLVAAIQQLAEPNMSDLTRGKLNALVAQLREIQLGIMTEGVRFFINDVKKLAAYEAQFEGKVLRAAIKRVKVQVPKAEEAFNAALKRPLSATGELIEPFIEDWTKKEVNAVSNLVRKGYANGWTNQEMTTALRGTKAAGYTDGIVAQVGKNASTIIRTSVQHVASTARAKTWAANADIVEEYRIVATLDNRTSPVCRSLDGEKFKLGAGPVPPLHPNCRSTTIAVLAEEFDFLDEGATRSSMQGYVEADQTYYEWLGKQPDSFQDSVIGKTRGELFRRGGLSAEEFARLNLSRTFEPLTLDQMRELEPEAFKKAGL